MRKQHIEENSFYKFSELDVEFIKKYWYFGNLRTIAKILKRTYYSLQNMTSVRGIKYNKGACPYSEEELSHIYDDAYRKMCDPKVPTLEHEAVKPTPALPPVKEVCPCNVEDTIIVKRIKLVNNGELWVCARCGRQIGCKRGDNI